MHATDTPTILTEQDVRALKHADALCFDHLRDGTGRIRAILRAENSPTGFEQTHEILAHSSRVEDYERTPHDGGHTAFAMLMSAKYNDRAQTIARHLRKGGQFTLHWVRDNNSPVTREAGIVVDFLDVRIASRTGSAVDVFRVDTYIGYDNTARMVKRA